MRGTSSLLGGGSDVRRLREQSGTFEKAFTIVVDRLAEREPENAEKLRGEYQRARVGDVTDGGPPALAAAETEKLRADPDLAAMYCMGLRDMVGEMGMLLTAVPRDGATSRR